MTTAILATANTVFRHRGRFCLRVHMRGMNTLHDTFNKLILAFVDIRQLSILTPNVGYYEWRHTCTCIYPPAHARASASRSLPNSDYGRRGKLPWILVVVKTATCVQFPRYPCHLVDDSVKTVKSMLYVYIYGYQLLLGSYLPWISFLDYQNLSESSEFPF